MILILLMSLYRSLLEHIYTGTQVHRFPAVFACQDGFTGLELKARMLDLVYMLKYLATCSALQHVQVRWWLNCYAITILNSCLLLIAGRPQYKMFSIHQLDLDIFVYDNAIERSAFGLLYVRQAVEFELIYMDCSAST